MLGFISMGMAGTSQNIPQARAEAAFY